MADRKRVGGIALYFYAHFQLIEKETIMKKITALLLLLAVLTASLFAPALAEKKITIVAATFPLYDWTRQVLGENSDAELVLLMDSGVDLHSFNPTAQDILRVASCDLFIYVGGESDEWVEDAQKHLINQDQIALSLMEILGEAAKEEELVEGMQAEEEEYDHDEDEIEYDEHVWLSLRNAQLFTQAIADALCRLDAENAEAYQANAAAYIAQLQELDARYADMRAKAAYDTILFGDRFPFRYLADDYDLNYYAAFSGCSAETEASFQTIVFLAGKTNELQLPAVLTIEGTDHRIAETIVQSTADKNQQVLTVDSMQGTTAKAISEGVTYLGVMEKNLAVFAQALDAE